MGGKNWMRVVALAALGIAAAGLIAPQIMALPGARRQQQAQGAAPVTLSLSSQPPMGAVVLFSGKEGEIGANWYQRYTMNPAKWTVDKEGVATPAKSDITSKQEFGDSYIHAEFRCPADAGGKAIGGGNSGVAPHGRYEIQILNSYGNKPESHGCGALYSQKAPVVNASKKPGEWQTYDIIFRAPRFDADGKVSEKPRATVFQNGILVQNNEEFLGMTGIQYSQYKEMVKTGPLILQGDHDAVQFRNVWVVPL
jgi:hypothetical protein